MSKLEGVEIKWEPQEKQAMALQSDADEILLGGSRGGGKTDAGIVFPLYHKDKSYYRGLLIRKNYTDLREWVDRAKRMYKGMAKFVNGEFRFLSGATIWLGHLADPDSYQKYQGFNIHNLMIEELTHLARENDYIKMLGSVRSVHDDIKPQVFATTNPDGPGHEWVKERWEIPDLPGDDPITTYRDVDVGDRVVRRKLTFIPSRVTENKYLADSDEYMSYLHSIPDEELKRAWLEGSWEGFGVEGAYYKTQFEQLEASDPPRIVEGLFDEQLPVYTWCDLGVRDSFSIVYAQFAHNQWRIIDYDEFEGESLKDVINRMKEKGYTYEAHYAPHDIKVRELGTGVSRWETAQNLGVTYEIVRRPETKLEPIDALRTRFINIWFEKDKTSLLRKRLKRFHKEFDEKRGVFKPMPAHDENSHGADAMGYFAMTEVYTPDLAQLQRVQKNRSRNRSYQ